MDAKLTSYSKAWEEVDTIWLLTSPSETPLPSHTPTTLTTSKHILNLLETNKFTKYAADYRNVGIDFMPSFFEMPGETSGLFSKCFKKLVACTADINNINYSIMFSYWPKHFQLPYSDTMLRSSHGSNKITRVTNLVRNGDIDLNGMIANEQHIHGDA
jgi:hypothetical protein